MKDSLSLFHSQLKNIKLLYVEDDSITREHTSELLSNIFDTIIIAVDGEDGVKKYQQNKIDLVITDINMPKLNGIEMLKKIKEIDENCSIIILSKCIESDILLQTIQLNVDGYIVKPFDLPTFTQILEKLIKKFKLSKETQNYKYYLEQYLSLLDKSGIISKTDTKGNIIYVNDSFCKISGYSREELLGKKHNITRHHENSKEIYDELWGCIKGKEETWEGVIKNKSKSGSSYYVRTIIIPIKDIEGNIVEYVGVRDNLNAVMDDKKYLFEQIEENELSILILLQINEFYMLEKFYNASVVDKVEKSFGFDIFSHLPKEYNFENVYSMGNGCFALLAQFNDFEKTKVKIEEYLHTFTQNIKNSILAFDDMEFDLSITISYATGKYMLYEDAKEGLESALRDKIKVSYSNDSSIVASKEAKTNLEMIKTVKIALDNYNIISYFQPIINNKTKQIEKYESLVRLIDEKGKILSPFHFLNISKQGSYYNKITQRVLENSFKILSTITTKLSINISAKDIETDQTRQQIFTLLEQYKDDAHRIVFELLEDEEIKDFDLIKGFIKEIKNKGVQIAIDDFGAGYSNFERILDFDPDILKIDGSLVKNIENDVFSRNIVETIVLFAKKQKIETIAEYVENESIYNILNEIGVDFSQGYYFGKPSQINDKNINHSY